MLQDITRFSRTFCFCSDFLLLENQSTVFQLLQDALGTMINHVCLILKVSENDEKHPPQYSKDQPDIKFQSKINLYKLGNSEKKTFKASTGRPDLTSLQGQLEYQNMFRVLTFFSYIYCTLSRINIMTWLKIEIWQHLSVSEGSLTGWENKHAYLLLSFRCWACVSDLVGGEVRRTVCGGAAPGVITVAMETGKGLPGCTAAALLGWTLVWTTGMGAIWMICEANGRQINKRRTI